RLQVMDQGLAVHVGTATGGAEEGVALDAFVGADGHQPQLALAGELAGMLAVLGRRNVVPGEQCQRQIDDLHGIPSSWLGGGCAPASYFAFLAAASLARSSSVFHAVM